MNFYLVLIILFLVIAIILRVDFVFYVLYVCAGIWLWSHRVVPRLLRQVRARRLIPSHAYWNEVFTARIEIENPSRLLIPWLEIDESVPMELRLGEAPDQVITLRGRERQIVSYQLLAKRRGLYRVGPLRLSTADLFGLGVLQTVTLPVDYVTVYPRLHPITRPGFSSRLPFGTLPTNQRLFEDHSRPVGVRAYRSGDPLRQINWKVTAHQRQLMVKSYRPAIALDAAIALNLNLEDYARRDRLAYIEWAIELAASLAAHLSERRQPVGLLTNGFDPMKGAGPAPGFDEQGRLARPAGRKLEPAGAMPPRNGRPHLMKILERLARLEPVTGGAFPAWLPVACQSLSWGTLVLVINPTGGRELEAVLHQLRRAGLNPVLILVNPLADWKLAEQRERGRQLGFAVTYLPTVHELAAWQGQLQERRPPG